jgi:ureidoglycolate hydrolase
MNLVDLNALSLGDEQFEPYGFRFDTAGRNADAEEVDFSFYYNLIEVDFQGPLAVSMVESKVQPGLFSHSLEVHMQTPEILIPLNGTIYLVLALSDKQDPTKPDLNTAKAFIVENGQGVSLPPGVWHRAPLSLSEPVKTCCIVRKGTPTDNITYYLEETYGLTYRVLLPKEK